MSRFKKIGVAASAASALVFIGAPQASANWSSHIDSWTDGQESRRWSDNGTYSQVQFRDCYAQNAGSSAQKVSLIMWSHIALAPDKKLDTKTFTNCFNGNTSWSNGEWTDVPAGPNTLYFEADKVGNGGSCCLLFVSEVKVDTSKAD
ncbi:hypothetical protein GCM10010232_35210 [Streptomyces amakusaensis]|uniref:Secreted protein n=1 Tax=Streptomyces amakusaensis TaxID=67271 RepID=A0ABW0AI58_9ACTN